jgi:hypothetical protein
LTSSSGVRSEFFPLAWLTITVLTLVGGADLTTFLANFLFVANLPPPQLLEGGGHLWSLWFEIYSSIVVGVLAAVFAKQFGSVHSFVPARLVSFGGVAVFSSALYGGLSYNAWAPLVAVCIVLFLAVRGQPMFMGKFLGGMSYPLYLNHWIGVFVGHALMSPFGMRDTVGRHVFSAIPNLG